MLKIMPDITFHQGMPGDSVQFKHFDPNVLSLIVFYLIRTVVNDDPAADLFTDGAHYRNISIIFIIQNLCFQGKQNLSRIISVNPVQYGLF